MAKDSPIQFKGTTLKIIQTQLRTADVEQLHTALAELTGNAPDFFEGELSVLDFSQATLTDITVDWAKIVKLLRQSGLNPVATCGLPADLAAHAASAGLPSVAADAFSNKPQRSTPPPAAAEPAAAAAAPVAPPPPAAPAVPQPAAPEASTAHNPPPAPSEPAARPNTVILDKPLRSGQRFYARGSDLIVMAMVSAGAEVIADGNIHVYAPLRGRALAGASGQRDARIFTTSLEAELVSVAGFYRTFEGALPSELARQPAVIRLIDDGNHQQLQVAPLALR